MKCRVYLLLLFLLLVSPSNARMTMRQWFTLMPDSVMPLLTKNNRLDFLDFFDCNMEAVVTNRLEGKSRMDTLSTDYLYLNYTESCDVEMKLLPLNDSVDILCMVTTVRSAVSDSRIAFFDKEWSPLSVSSYVALPTVDDFRNTAVSDTLDGWSKLDVSFITYQLSPHSLSLDCNLSALDYLNRDDRLVVERLIKGTTLSFHWLDGKFRYRDHPF